MLYLCVLYIFIFFFLYLMVNKVDYNVNLSAEVVKTAQHGSFSNQSTLATFLCQSTALITTAAAATVDDISAV